MERERNEEQKLDQLILLDDVLKEVRRFWWLAVVLVVLCAGVLAGRQYATYRPTYTATSTFTVKVANPLYASTSAYNIKTAEQMAATFPYILTSGVLQERVREHLGISYMPAIRVESSPNSNLLTLSVTDPDPQRAYDVLNAVITYYPEIAEFVVGPTVLALLDESGLPTAPSNPMNPVGAIKKGAVLGAALWAALMFALGAMKQTVHNEDELNRILNCPCLSQIPAVKASRRNGYPLISVMRNGSAFSESIQLLRLNVERSMAEGDKRVLLISSAMPGEGKTTVSVNLATSLARSGKKVLLIDCDLRNPSVADALKVKSKYSLMDFLKGKISARDLFKATLTDNLTIIASSSGEENDTHLLTRETMFRLIHTSRKFFDYVIMDTPPCSLLADAAEVSSLADCSLMVIRQSFASRGQILDGVQHLGDRELPMIGCVLNCVSRGISDRYGYGYGYGYGYDKSKK